MVRRPVWPWVMLVLAVALAWQAQGIVQRRLAERWLAAAQSADRRGDWFGEQRTTLTLGQQTVTSRVSVEHQAPDRTRREYLDGELAGTVAVQDGRRQWRRDPQLGWVVASAGAADIPVDLAGWRVRVRPGGAVAGRPTVHVALRRQDVRRDLWLDRVTAQVLRARSNRPGQYTDTVVEQFHLGRPAQPADFGPPGGPERALANEEPLADSARQLGFPLREPQWLPRGYRQVGAYCYHCPCGCGMLAAHLVYSDGLGQVSVFLQDQAHAGCILSDGCCRAGSEAGGCVLAPGSAGPLVARVDRQPLVVVMGDLPTADLARIADSVPAAQTR